MSATEKVVNDLNVSKLTLCNPKMLTSEMCVRIGQAINGAIDLLKKQEAVVRCKDCRKNMMCEMTIHKPRDWYCADGERKEGR
jgi:hypothetical protein